MIRKGALILDCGATNVKACLIDETGRIAGSHSLGSETFADPYFPGGLIWDIDDIWNKLVECSRRVISASGDTEITVVTVTTFGVDGAAVKKDGTICYPVISWQCGRTVSVEQKLDRYFDRNRLYAVTGLQSYHFNTLNKLVWLRENRPDVLECMDYYMLMPSLILQRLTGVFVNDATMAGTTMLADLKQRTFSTEILQILGIDPGKFSILVEPGTRIGEVSQAAAVALGLPAGIPVTASGHDTQFALLAAGAGVNQPVLSSGTWEILMERTPVAGIRIPDPNSGITIELDAVSGLVNPGIQWVASGVLEWFARLLYNEIADSTAKYETMIAEASGIPPGCNGTWVIPDLFPGLWRKEGNIGGLTHETGRGSIYRAAIESLCFSLAYGLEKLNALSNHPVSDLICVGGGSKNRLWNQIRADVTGIPVNVLDMKETTALGAAMMAFTGTGVFNNLDEAMAAMKNQYTVYEPGINREVYSRLNKEFQDHVRNSN